METALAGKELGQSCSQERIARSRTKRLRKRGGGTQSYTKHNNEVKEGDPVSSAHGDRPRSRLGSPLAQ